MGAFGAHALKASLGPDRMAIYQTGVLYHLLHAVLLVSLSQAKLPPKILDLAGRLILAGIVIFSGSLYALAITDTPKLGAITPIGGVCFLAGWATIVIATLKKV